MTDLQAWSSLMFGEVFTYGGGGEPVYLVRAEHAYRITQERNALAAQVASLRRCATPKDEQR